jgi:two-component system CheB/CheR fusion protein
MDQSAQELAQLPSSPAHYVHSHLSFLVAGIGASAGGLAALVRLLEGLPADCGMAVVVVLHLDPQRESEMPRLLQAHAKMPVTQVNATMPLEANHVYVIAPGHDLLMNDGCLQVARGARPFGRRNAIDLFLRSLAEVHRERAAGIILSGSDADGTVGIARIKETGGITLAQDPKDAEYADMPLSAIRSGMVDIVLPAAEMPARLLQLAARVRPPQPAGEAQAGPDRTELADVREILDILAMRTGNDFGCYRGEVQLQRIRRRMHVLGMDAISDYRDFLRDRPEETDRLLDDFFLSLSNFFRDRDAFALLERSVIAELFANVAPGQPVRAWSVGCASGEEVYSLAMLFAEAGARSPGRQPAQLFATDINPKALEVARSAHYPQSIAADVSPARLQSDFILDGGRYRIRTDLRKTVVFAAHDVLRDPPFARLHLVCCRYLLSLMSEEASKRILETLHYALAPGGCLMLGSTESVEAAPGLFEEIDARRGLYRALRIPSPLARRFLGKGSGVSQQATGGRRTVHGGERRRVTAQQIHRQLLESEAPPSILLDAEGRILYSSDQAGRFLHFSGGEPSRDIGSLIAADLRSDLRTALMESRRLGERIETRRIPQRRGAEDWTVRMVVKPAPQDDEGAGNFLLLFIEERQRVARPPKDEGVAPEQVLLLERELCATREHLQATVQRYETSLEDAQALNEELQSANEELRSAAEELAGSKEELHSTNEELQSVNEELKLRVEEGAQLNDDLQNFVASTGTVAIFIDRELRIRRYTRASNRLFNLIASDIGRPLFDISHRIDYPGMAADIAMVFETLQMIEREVRGGDGTWYIARLLPYRTSEEKLDGLVLSFIDISRRKAAEENLRLSEERLRLISASIRDYAIVALDLEGKITSWNSGAERLFGYAEAEMLDASAALLQTPEDQQQDVFARELRVARDSGRAEDERWLLRKDGSRVYCSGVLSPLGDGRHGMLRGYVKVIRDATGSRSAQEEQAALLNREKQERIRAEEAARLRDEFFAVLSHELKQPLNLIQLTAEMLARMPESAQLPAVERGATTIKRMVEGQARIIDDLMDLSRLHTGKLTLSRTQVNLSECVAHVVNLTATDAQNKRVAVSLEMAPRDMIVQGDVVRLEQIVWNLLSNALKFTPAGGQVKVRLSEDDGGAHLEVIDTGKGIPQEFLPVIFEMFRQADTGTTRKYGGMGIGLALVRELVLSHGGKVEAQSEGEGRGAEFHVHLPLAQSRYAAAPTRRVGADSLKGKRILIVDDEVDMLESFAGLLRMAGAEVHMADSPGAALQRAAEETRRYDLIVSDIGMPDMDGYALLAELRGLASTESTPAIAVSGFTRERDVRQALDAGFETHMRKPLAFDNFIGTAARMLG